MRVICCTCGRHLQSNGSCPCQSGTSIDPNVWRRKYANHASPSVTPHHPFCFRWSSKRGWHSCIAHLASEFIEWYSARVAPGTLPTWAVIRSVVTFLTRFSPAQMGRILKQPPVYLDSRMTVPPRMADSLLTLLKRQFLEHRFLCLRLVYRQKSTVDVGSQRQPQPKHLPPVVQDREGEHNLHIPLSWSKRPSRLYDRHELRLRDVPVCMF